MRFILSHKRARDNAIRAVIEAEDGYSVEIKPPSRSLEQNARLWAMLTTLSERLPWDGERLSPAEYKDLLTACWRKQKVVRGIEGGLVFLGQRSSQMDKREFSDLIELVHAFAAERGVSLLEEATL